PPRKKACQQCTNAKTRCDLQRPTCSRCQLRGLDCRYAAQPELYGEGSAPSSRVNYSISAERSSIVVQSAASSSTSHISNSNSTQGQPGPIFPPISFDLDEGLIQGNMSAMSPAYDPFRPSSPVASGSYSTPTVTPPSTLDTDLVSSVDPSRIRSRWLDQILASPDQRPKHLSELAVSYMSQVLKTYPKMMLRQGGLPPLIHHSQAEGERIPVPLANCLSLVRMWENRAPGSEMIAIQTIKWEMERLFREVSSFYGTYEQMELLAAFQAYLIYSIMLFFSSSEDGKSVTDRTVMINLQELACRVAQTGLVCAAELSHCRPRWESWIVASAKRRTLYIMYFLDNVYCTLNHIPCHIAEELGSLLAPASKALWEARTKEKWEREYDIHLAAWNGGGLRIGELWASRERGTATQQERIQRWLESVDEYGMMYFSVSAMIHGL
ncbi:hypothetical protein GLOTRDRAFT_36217, partial [Gloeophyllum trabeum ATCC 11539]